MDEAIRELLEDVEHFLEVELDANPDDEEAMDLLDRISQQLRDDSEADEEPDEPSEGDYVITSRGYLGSETVVQIYGERREFRISPDEDVDVAIREDMIAQEFFPNVWILSDHGNYHLTSVTGR